LSRLGSSDGMLGNWNFDSDDACEYLIELENQLRREINAFDTADLWAMDECLIMPRIEVWMTLCEQFKASPPETAELTNWRDTLLRVWDETTKELIDSEKDCSHRKSMIDQFEERRKVISATFEKFSKFACGS